MKKTKVCYVCHARPAEVPDRYRTGRPVARICRECHSDRLREDFRLIAQASARMLANPIAYGPMKREDAEI